MTIIALWRCPDCGWTRSGEYGGKCRNAFAHESIDAPKVERVEYVPADDHRGAVEEAAERIFASGILDEIAASDGGGGRDAMQDAVTIARLALGGQ